MGQSSLHDPACIYHTRSLDQTTSKQRSDSTRGDGVHKKKKVRFHLGPPPKQILELLDMAEEELLSDIARLPYDRENVMKSEAVIDKYSPPAIYKGMRQWPELTKSFNALRFLEYEVMRERMDVQVMMARIGPDEPDTGDQDESAGQSGIPQEAHVNGTASEEQPPRTLNLLDQAPVLLPPSQPDSIGSSLRGSPLHRAVDRLLMADGYVAPNPSPALSNDPGETLGNLTQLTEHLEIESGRVNSAGIIPQSRFGTPEYWQENAALQRQYEEMRSEPSPMTRGSISHFSDDSSDVPPDGPPRLVQPRPTRPGEPSSPVLQRTFHAPFFHTSSFRIPSPQGDTPPRAMTPSRLPSTSESEAGSRNKRRKRNKSEAGANDEKEDAKFRERWDSIWSERGRKRDSGDEEDTKGSGGSSGAVAG